MWDYLKYPGFWLMAGKYWDPGMKEFYRSFVKKALLKSLQELVPSIKSEDIKRSASGVRAQALSINGDLIDDFRIICNDNVINVLNAPSPAATSALSIGLNIKNYYQMMNK